MKPPAEKLYDTEFVGGPYDGKRLPLTNRGRNTSVLQFKVQGEVDWKAALGEEEPRTTEAGRVATYRRERWSDGSVRFVYEQPRG